jgi:hypothetical protein
MTKSKFLIIILLIVAFVGAGMVFARRYPGRRYSNRGYYGRGRRDTFQRNVPNWTPNREFSNDVFTFVRIRYTSSYAPGLSGGNWATDYPDSDWNFSFRLHQLTSMKVDPNGLVLELTDPRLFNYPFIYFLEPGRLIFSDEEVKCLRRYLLNGGFLMVDDFWGVNEWDNFYYEIKRVFPDREPVEVGLDHPIFHAVFDLKEKPQIPSIDVALRGRPYGITWEREDARHVDYRAIYDEKGRMMVFICHNTDLGDGWEREGEDEWFFHEFSEKKAYPLGINIVFYAMTH